jgi:hypothetical protein
MERACCIFPVIRYEIIIVSQVPMILQLIVLRTLLRTDSAEVFFVEEFSSRSIAM